MIRLHFSDIDGCICRTQRASHYFSRWGLYICLAARHIFSRLLRKACTGVWLAYPPVDPLYLISLVSLEICLTVVLVSRSTRPQTKSKKCHTYLGNSSMENIMLSPNYKNYLRPWATTAGHKPSQPSSTRLYPRL